MKRYAVKAIDPRGFVTYCYFCNADLVPSVTYWCGERHPGCSIEVSEE